MADDSAGEKPGRGPGRPFEPGQTGNRAGRPPGSRNKVTVAIEALLDGQAEALTSKAIQMALGGDGLAMRLCLERVAPVRRGRPVHFTLPEIATAADVVKGIGSVLVATATGELTPDEAATIAGILETKRRSIEVTELEARLAKLEQDAGERGR